MNAPAPTKPDAHNVCSRAKNHYDPQLYQQLFGSDTVTDTTTQEGAGGLASGGDTVYERYFQHAHERMASVMYFC